MRRKDREIKDFDEILDVINDCKVARIGMKDENGIYIVPMNFGYSCQDEKLSLYFHSAKEGRKISALNKNNKVCVEMDCNHNLVEGKAPCAYSYNYQSLIANGNAIIIDDVYEKINALKIIMKHQTGDDFSFLEKHANAVAIIRIDVTSFTGKKHL